ncbi:MAG: NifU family protein [Chryseobacterium sp.]|nr:MAG: NifU family protein [Chryseobacterium sp.]
MDTGFQQAETVNKVLDALSEIRPFLNRDGGDIELIEVKESRVYVKLLGNCSSCPVNTSTMKLGVENTIKKHAPEILDVISVE